MIRDLHIKNKEYLPIIFVLPTVLGALVQLIQLISISPTFYKFFSISQSIIDGSYLFFQLILITVIVNLLNHFANSDEFYFFRNQIYKSSFNNEVLTKKIIEDYELEDAKVLFLSDVYLIMDLQNTECLWQKAIFKTDRYFEL